MLTTGKLYTTRTINNEMATDMQFSKEITDCLLRYKLKDWGDISEEDKAMNNEAVNNGNDRIFATYKTSKGKVYIITECDRSLTTVLFADEY